MNIRSLTSLEIETFQLKGPDPTQIFVDQMLVWARSAITKTRVEDLTEQEKFALAYAAGVPMSPFEYPDGQRAMMKMTTAVQVGFFHNGEKWVVMQDKPESRRTVRFMEERKPVVPPPGYSAEELDRDNPYNQFMNP